MLLLPWLLLCLSSIPSSRTGTRQQRTFGIYLAQMELSVDIWSLSSDMARSHLWTTASQLTVLVARQTLGMLVAMVGVKDERSGTCGMGKEEEGVEEEEKDVKICLAVP